MKNNISVKKSINNVLKKQISELLLKSHKQTIKPHGLRWPGHKTKHKNFRGNPSIFLVKDSDKNKHVDGFRQHKPLSVHSIFCCQKPHSHLELRWLMWAVTVVSVVILALSAF